MLAAVLLVGLVAGPLSTLALLIALTPGSPPTVGCRRAAGSSPRSSTEADLPIRAAG
jgi:hypothetical protein